MQNNTSKLNILLLIIVIVLLGAVLMQSVSVKSKRNENITEQKTQTKDNSDSGDASFREYKNDEIGISFKYQSEHLALRESEGSGYFNIISNDGVIDIIAVPYGFQGKIYSGSMGECLGCLLSNFLAGKSTITENKEDTQTLIPNNGIAVIEHQSYGNSYGKDIYSYVFPLKSGKYAAIGFQLDLPENERNQIINSIKVY